MEPEVAALRRKLDDLEGKWRWSWALVLALAALSVVFVYAYMSVSRAALSLEERISALERAVERPRDRGAASVQASR